MDCPPERSGSNAKEVLNETSPPTILHLAAGAAGATGVPQIATTQTNVQIV